MNITGKNLIGNELSSQGGQTFRATNPADGSTLDVDFHEAQSAEVGKAVELAESAFETYRNISGAQRADFLDAIGDQIVGLGDTLLERCNQETGLPLPRLTGERGRTVGQLKLFAQLIRDGHWVDARIDTAIPDRQPLPKSDIRMMQRPLGPVGVFGASNFPLAFSVAGGDTASALAAGCTVVVKGHPAHPGTSELVGQAIIAAAKATGMPEGVFSLVQGTTVEVGMAIVNHPLIKAIGFTGSYGGGKAIFDAANQRAEPIPVYAEMGSTNPVFILPNALKERKENLAEGLKNSVTLGVGQFCTNPGITVTMDSEDSNEFSELLSAQFEGAGAATMLTKNIKSAYDSGLATLQGESGVELLSKGGASDGESAGIPHVLKTSVKDFIDNDKLEHEVFGPSTLLVSAGDKKDLLDMAKGLSGHLTSTLIGTDEDLKEHADLISVLERKVGRLIINGYPTGVEVCHSMVHGGPFPSTTDSRMTSVGTGAITRFSRPVCYQDFPEFLLPDELKNGNPLGIRRLVDGKHE
ncbi:MAG: aldehyde dehydrogenase (NADP(+)) [Cyclobacteriaceae bacterium]